MREVTQRRVDLLRNEAIADEMNSKEELFAHIRSSTAKDSFEIFYFYFCWLMRVEIQKEFEVANCLTFSRAYEK
jgi:hypothetical protein